MLAPANYYFLHQELCFFVCLQPVKMLHNAPLNQAIFIDVLMYVVAFHLYTAEYNSSSASNLRIIASSIKLFPYIFFLCNMLLSCCLCWNQPSSKQTHQIALSETQIMLFLGVAVVVRYCI